MEIAVIGLGKMGGNMVRRLLRDGHRVVALDRDKEAVARATSDGAVGVLTIDDAVAQTSSPRTFWVMVPSGAPTEETIVKLASMLSPNDILIDGGNSNFRDSVRRSAMLAEKKIRMLDAGTSGGVWGLEIGYCLMVGGDESAYQHALPALTTLAPKDGLGYFGKAGAGHFSKMVHNGIEYAMMQAYAEGLELLQATDYKYDLAKLTGVWNNGSVIRSWLLELAERAFKKDPQLASLKAYAEDSGEGRWTVNEAVAHAVPVPTIAASLFARFASRQDNSFAMRVVSALRNEFGGHAVKKA